MTRRALTNGDRPDLRTTLAAALTVALLVATALLERRGNHRTAGFVAAPALFKPQFGLPLTGSLLLLRQSSIVAGWLVGVVVLWSVNTVVLGPRWVDRWAEHLLWHRRCGL